MGKISIGLVLAEIDQTLDESGNPNTFSLSYSKSDGTYGHIAKAQKSVKDDRHKPDGQPSGSNHNPREFGNLLLWSHDKQGYREIKIHLITRYNGHKIHFG